MKFFISAILIFAMAATGCAQYNGQILRTKSEGLTPAERAALYQKVSVQEKNGAFYVDGLPLPEDILMKHYEENGAYPHGAWTFDKIWKLGIGGYFLGAAVVSGAFQGNAGSAPGYLNPAVLALAIAVPLLISGLTWDWSNYAQNFNSFACEEIGAEHCEKLPEAK